MVAFKLSLNGKEDMLSRTIKFIFVLIGSLFFSQFCFAFQTAEKIQATPDFLLSYVKTPDLAADKYNAVVRYLFIVLQFFENSAERCILQRKTTVGCDMGKNGVQSWTNTSDQPTNPIGSISTVNGKITITPTMMPEIGLHPDKTIIATATLVNDKVEWDYSGGLFDAHPQSPPVNIAPTYCPDPQILRNALKKNDQLFADPESNKKYRVIGFNETAPEPEEGDYSFLRAHYDGNYQGIIYCIYSVVNLKQITVGATTVEQIMNRYMRALSKNKWFELSAEQHLATTPSGEHWKTLDNNQGECPPVALQGGDVKNCPFLLLPDSYHMSAIAADK